MRVKSFKFKSKKVKLKKKQHKKSVILFVIALAMAVFFMLPTVLTIANSFMSPQEIKANYGMIFNDQILRRQRAGK